MPLDLGWRMHSCPWLHGGLRVQWLLQWDSRSTAASVGTEKKGGGGGRMQETRSSEDAGSSRLCQVERAGIIKARPEDAVPKR